jgi:retinol dehydrogenase 12
MGFVTQTLYSQLFFTPPYPTHDFTGQTVIVTGSNVGLGLEAARHFARLNCAKLILAVRTISKGEKAKESILSSTKRTSDCIEVWPLDLSSSASVKAFARRAGGLERVDVMVENAGLSVAGYEIMEGNEASLQVNVINTFLLALLMLPKMRETAKKFGTTPHLEIVSSEAHFMAGFPEKNEDDIYAKLNDEKEFKLFDR